ncbi:MAG: hypothetical protein PHR35_18195, partial [Kiritimatiellae bacterium]|nr:hypothetical protein [Kiritimatiellia bacterium]
MAARKVTMLTQFMPPTVLVMLLLTGSPAYADKAPHPYYVETVASFNSAISAVPQGVIDRITNTYTVAVSGLVGAVSLAVTGTPPWDEIAGSWNGTIKYDDGTYGVLTVKSVDKAGTRIAIAPALKKNAVHGELSNTYDGHQGQHYTAPGYYALAQHIYDYGRETACRERIIARTAVSEDKVLWVKHGGWFTHNYNLNTFPASHPEGTFFHSNHTRMDDFIGRNPGESVTASVELGGASGYLETYVGLREGVGPIEVVATFDGAIAYSNATIIGLERITVPFTDARQGTVSVKVLGSTGSTVRIGTTTWWGYDHPADYRGKRLIPDGSKVVFYGDSWGV